MIRRPAASSLREAIPTSEATQSEARFQALFDKAPVAIGLTRAGHHLYANPAYRLCFGIGAGEDVAGLPILDLIAPEERERVVRAVGSRVGHEAPGRSYEFTAVRRDGTRFPAQVEVAQIELPDGTATLAFLLDITARKENERALRESEQRLRLLTDHLPAIIAYLDGEERYRFVNAAYGEWFESRAPDILGRSMREVLGEELYAQRLPHLEAVRRGELARFEAPMRHRTLGMRDCELTYVPERGPDGKLRGLCIMVQDVTERRRAEAAIARQLSELEGIYRSAPIGLCILDRELRFVRINERLAEINGLPVDAHIGRSVREVVPELAESIEPVFRRILETGEPVIDYELTGRTAAQPDVDRTWLESWYPLRDARGDVIGINVVAEEITERKSAESHRELLIHELRHRVKNTLAVVQSLASQTMRRSYSMRSFSAAFTGRLGALAEAHDLLMREGWGRVELREMIERTHAAECGAGRVTLDGPAVEIDPNAAVSLSMALHELSTNAAKYGALARVRGRVSLRWTLTSDPARIEIVWRERGGPRIEAPTEEGFGSRLLKSLERELGATIERAFHPEGLECRIVLPHAGIGAG